MVSQSRGGGRLLDGRVAVVTGGSRRCSATSPESTLGTGQNTPGGTEPARRALQYQASFTDGTPYTFDPGGATSRSATSDCTITSPLRTLPNVASTCNSTGTLTL